MLGASRYGAAIAYGVILSRRSGIAGRPDVALARTMLEYGFRVYVAILVSFLVIRLDLLLVNAYLGLGRGGALLGRGDDSPTGCSSCRWWSASTSSRAWRAGIRRKPAPRSSGRLPSSTASLCLVDHPAGRSRDPTLLRRRASRTRPRSTTGFCRASTAFGMLTILSQPLRGPWLSAPVDRASGLGASR